MLIRFTVQNWLSYRDTAELTMVASREQQNSHQNARVTSHRLNILPIATIYGGNASGKSNLFKAISFAKHFITHGTGIDQRIAVSPFRLDISYHSAPSVFVFEILIADQIYEFQFSVTAQQVVHEKLSHIRPTVEHVVYERHGQQIVPGKIGAGEKAFWQFAHQAVRPNQLFITTGVQLMHAPFLPIYQWFREHLVLIAPDARFEEFERFVDKRNPQFETMNHFLHSLDTGITELAGQDIPFDVIPFPDDLKSHLQRQILDGQTVRLVDFRQNERIVITRQNGELNAQKIVGQHRRVDGAYESFTMAQESDGTNRIIDLLPAFLDVFDAESAKVVIIDEVDRSLHTLITKNLIERFLESRTKDTRSQLFVTMHDVLLMNQRTLRRDEMWITERDSNGASTLHALSDFIGIRADKDVRKSYLQGRFGGIPRILW